jgi:hypothetical protein
VLDAGQRTTLAALADVLIPGEADMPSASEAAAHEKWLDRTLQARPDLEADLLRVVTEAADRDPAAEVRRLNEHEPELFRVLALAVSGAYYMNLKVRKRIGYPGQKSNPPFPDEADYYLEGGLLDPVLARGSSGKAPPGANAPAPVRPAPSGKRPDALVIGAGAAGSVAAKRLAEAGFSVVCLEQGGWRNAAEFPGDKLEFELLVGKQWNADPNIRARPEDYPT